VDYLFEQLGPEPFQQFCQALLVQDYPDLQCFPVGQPDGGRDALSRGDGALPSVVAQVKYKRRDEEDNADWMLSALEGELPKIQVLKDRGVQQYIMLTNASGTSHLDVGRIDKAQAWLDEHSPIPGVVLWRDDLSRRLDGQNDLKLSYPGLLTGSNALTLIYEAMFGPKQAHLANVMRMFVADQFLRDAEVKFRQVDLLNTLNALFVDVPVDIHSFLNQVNFGARARDPKHRYVRSSLMQGLPTYFTTGVPVTRERNFRFGGFDQTAGTADLLLSASMQGLAPRVVLQGAPGQGKSTIAQYVCQVHRARLLEKVDFLESISPAHRDAPFRLPLKVDLRDLAAFVDGREYMQHAPEASESDRTFERFLASVISIQAQSDSFSVDDLRTILLGSPTLIFLDGLDEVADTQLRERMLEGIKHALNRLTDIGADLQVVITSRPAQLGQSAKLPEEFVRLNMAPLGIDVVRQYAGKWTVAKSLDEGRTAEVNAILDSKLDLEHIRELTKNPMQLTILLTLIHQIGHSLPDARTDLYREYVNLFMTREAEKDAVVRTHKALLLQIVEYLAWELQSKAEAEGGAGSIGSAELKQLVGDYLRRTKRDDAILGQLFERGLDRIYVLVQRIEGLYEFEVQPLREYFAAKYLHSTAPMISRWGKTVRGDRIQRFEAIAANPYWANVTRFYAGFWEQGEVLALSASLREMISKGSLEVALNARAMGASLLTDRAFSAKPFVQEEVISAVFDRIGVHLTALSRLTGYESFVLVRECGRDFFARLIFDEHIRVEGVVVNTAICNLLRRNGGSALGAEFTTWVEEASGHERTRRLGVAASCGGLDAHSADQLLQLLAEDSPLDPEIFAQRRQRLFSGIDSDQLNDKRLLLPAFEDVLRNGGYGCFAVRNDVALFAMLLVSPHIFMAERMKPVHGGLPENYAVAIEAYQNAVSDYVPGSSDALLVASVEVLHKKLGSHWVVFRNAITAESRMESKRAISGGSFEALSLSDQVARARRWRGRSSWWSDRILPSSGATRLFWIGVLVGWGQSAQVKAALTLLESEVSVLPQEDLDRLEDVLADIEYYRTLKNGRRRAPVAATGVSDRLARLLVSAFGPEQERLLPGDVAADASFAEFAERNKLINDLNEFPGWEAIGPRSVKKWLGVLRLSRARQQSWSAEVERRLLDPRRLPKSAASQIVAHATSYDAEVVAVAVSAVQLAHRPTTVRALADSEDWEF
jgi:hypothetical protein